MRNTLIASTMLGLLAISPAMAWDYNQTGGHGNQQIGDGATGVQNNNRAQARANSQSTASSRSNANASGGTSSASLSGNNNVSIGSVSGGSGSSGGAGVPSLYVPDGAGQAGCGGGIGLGGMGLGGGGSGGGTLFEFADCKRIREASSLRAMRAETGDPRLEQAALNELCQIGRVRDAFGGKCPVIGETKVVDSVKANDPDYCFTRNAGDVNQHYECDRHRVIPVDAGRP